MFVETVTRMATWASQTCPAWLIICWAKTLRLSIWMQPIPTRTAISAYLISRHWLITSWLARGQTNRWHLLRTTLTLIWACQAAHCGQPATWVPAVPRNVATSMLGARPNPRMSLHIPGMATNGAKATSIRLLSTIEAYMAFMTARVSWTLKTMRLMCIIRMVARQRESRFMNSSIIAMPIWPKSMVWRAISYKVSLIIIPYFCPLGAL